MAAPRLKLFVGFALTAAIVSMLLSWGVAIAFPGYWQLGCFILIAFLLDQTNLPLRTATGKLKALGLPLLNLGEPLDDPALLFIRKLGE